MKKRLFNIAWSIVDQFESFSQALAYAWKVVRFHYALCTNAVVRFAYFKVEDGTIREAVGTLVNVPNPKLGDRRDSNPVMRYFDLEQGAYRSFRITHLIISSIYY